MMHHHSQLPRYRLPHLKMENGPGPHSTPLILGDRVFTIGILARMHAFDKATGKLLWTKDLIKDFKGAEVPDRGYSASPVAYKDTIILKLSGPNHAIVALKPADGSLVWAKHSFEEAASTPIIVAVDGQEQLITTSANEVVGLDPNNGNLLWSHPHRTMYGLNISAPLLMPGNVVVVTSAYNGGARGLKLTKSGGKTTVSELWQSNRFRVHFHNAIPAGGLVCGSSGDFGPAPMTCVEPATGKVLFQDRAFSKASIVRAGGDYVLLDEDGTLGLVELAPGGMKVKARAQVLRSNAWTAPTLAGTTLYARDRREIAAFDLK